MKSHNTLRERDVNGPVCAGSGTRGIQLKLRFPFPLASASFHHPPTYIPLLELVMYRRYFSRIQGSLAICGNELLE